jgi:hypothetical protein
MTTIFGISAIVIFITVIILWKTKVVSVYNNRWNICFSTLPVLFFCIGLYVATRQNTFGDLETSQQLIAIALFVASIATAVWICYLSVKNNRNAAIGIIIGLLKIPIAVVLLPFILGWQFILANIWLSKHLQQYR